MRRRNCFNQKDKMAGALHPSFALRLCDWFLMESVWTAVSTEREENRQVAFAWIENFAAFNPVLDQFYISFNADLVHI